MPSKYIVKTYAENAYYHVFNRGVNKQDIFRDEEDYSVFLNLLKRHLGDEPATDKSGRPYGNYREGITLLAFCLMPNHYHLLVLQAEPEAMTQLMRSVCTAYTMYYNKKYNRVGHLFQGAFKASMILYDSYLEHISRYIHLNPEDYLKWSYSSLDYYLDKKHASWINSDLLMEDFTPKSYLAFLSDYKDHRAMLKEIKSELANS